MKVLLTATVQSHICQFHRPLARMLHDAGHEVHVAARDNLAEKNGLKLDFVDKVFDIPFSRSPTSTSNIKAYKQLKKIIDESKYEVVHCNTPMGSIITRLAAKKARKKGTKVYYTAHGFHFYQGASKKNWIVYYTIEKHFAKMTDKLITITEEDFKLASKKFKTNVYHIHGVGASSSKFYVMSDEEKEAIRHELGFSNTERVLLNVGELRPNKNQATAIRTMAEVLKTVPEAKLLIAGNGPDKENLDTLCKELGLEEKVILLGYTTQLEKYLSICEILVACSFREGLPLNVMEAMLCGKPIVASLNRGHRELVKDGVNGFMVNAINVTEYAEKILELLTNNNKMMEFGNNGMELAQLYTDYAIYNELKEIYEI